ncbi:hypothetical protein PUN28_008970 [Cardiocondyla obscurior]|uniref:Uncharacterized protein n=1 Tax=Cardiocondyla obscurior TaxID=286306 RepID=A0AAW2FQA6_9HYME
MWLAYICKRVACRVLLISVDIAMGITGFTARKEDLRVTGRSSGSRVPVKNRATFLGQPLPADMIIIETEKWRGFNKTPSRATRKCIFKTDRFCRQKNSLLPSRAGYFRADAGRMPMLFRSVTQEVEFSTPGTEKRVQVALLHIRATRIGAYFYFTRGRKRKLNTNIKVTERARGREQTGGISPTPVLTLPITLTVMQAVRSPRHILPAIVRSLIVDKGNFQASDTSHFEINLNHKSSLAARN